MGERVEINGVRYVPAKIAVANSAQIKRALVELWKLKGEDDNAIEVFAKELHISIIEEFDPYDTGIITIESFVDSLGVK